MKAIAVFPGKPSSIHISPICRCRPVDEIPNGRGVLVKVLRGGR